MQITSEAVGSKLLEYRTVITQRQINNYAAAVNDPNPHYLDDEASRGLIAPPTMISAVTWPIIQNIEQYIDLGYPPEVLFQLVHYSEHLEISRPLKPGDSITIRGEVAAIQPEKKGTYIVFKLPALDSNHNPLFTEYIGGMLRNVKCPDGGRGFEKIPPTLTALNKNSFIWEKAQPISRLDCYIYAGCANVPFPIHNSPAFAHSVGLPDIIYQGMATLAHAIRELVNREAGANPNRVKSISCRFKGMVSPDTFIRIRLLERSENGNSLSLLFHVLNQDNREAVSEGHLTLSPGSCS
ncbi:MAG: MaoC/PaaZ C-terminal domain-containing protein [Bacillota bacterium]